MEEQYIKISRYRYEELKFFCLQFEEWEDVDQYVSFIRKSRDSTLEFALDMLTVVHKMEIINEALKKSVVNKNHRKYIFNLVCHGKGYMCQAKEDPSIFSSVTKDEFYMYLKRFYEELDKIKE